ncbi:hypothetical protein C5167_049802 [Papaver somniferum]|uniref:Uncharacterized protein n=1 Tax=Papaver somniferum TaxID=3469 RepID=A0A4Y7KLU7_PAPSO|nr:hypothetical protein C5167_049802 [Papaver somniferum]
MAANWGTRLGSVADCTVLGNDLLKDIDCVQANNKVRNEGSLTAAATVFCGYHASRTLQFLIDAGNRGLQRMRWHNIELEFSNCRVVLESLRMASIISFTFREAVEDVEYKGYLTRSSILQDLRYNFYF